MSVSPFLFMHRKNLTLREDSELYEQANSSLYKREAWRFLYLSLFCKLYDMSNLPIPTTHKVYAYVSFVVVAGSLSFYHSSLAVTDLLMLLDEKYTTPYERHIKSMNYEGII